MDERSNAGGTAEAADIAELKARVAELERVVTALMQPRNAGMGTLPPRRAVPIAPPPPPVPAIAAPSMAAGVCGWCRGWCRG